MFVLHSRASGRDLPHPLTPCHTHHACQDVPREHLALSNQSQYFDVLVMHVSRSAKSNIVNIVLLAVLYWMKLCMLSSYHVICQSHWVTFDSMFSIIFIYLCVCLQKVEPSLQEQHVLLLLTLAHHQKLQPLPPDIFISLNKMAHIYRVLKDLAKTKSVAPLLSVLLCVIIRSVLCQRSCSVVGKSVEYIIIFYCCCFIYVSSLIS